MPNGIYRPEKLYINRYAEALAYALRSLRLRVSSRAMPASAAKSPSRFSGEAYTNGSIFVGEIATPCS
jgi:hypothetical protein